MREKIAVSCQQYSDMHQIVKSGFRKERVPLYGPCVGLLMGRNVEMTTKKLQKYWSFLLEHNKGLYSTVRGASKVGVTAMLCGAQNPKQRAEEMTEAQEVLKKYFPNSQILPLSAMVLADAVAPELYDAVAKRANALHHDLVITRPICTGEEDVIFCILLASKGMRKEIFHERMEQYVELLKGTFKVNAGLQNLALVLMLSPGKREEKCKKTVELFNCLKDRGVKYPVTRELACLGALASYPEPVAQIAEDLMDADAFLAKRKEYGFFGCDKKARFLHACMIADTAYRREKEDREADVREAEAVRLAEEKMAAMVKEAEEKVETIAEKVEELVENLAEKAEEKLEALVEKILPDEDDDDLDILNSELNDDFLDDIVVAEEEEELEEIKKEEEEIEIEDNNYHPPVGDLLCAIVIEQVAVGQAVKNRAGTVSAYANARDK